MRKIARLIDGLSRMLSVLSEWLVLAMALLVFIEVLSRYVLHRPLMVGDEFSAYMFVAIAFLGAAYTWRDRGHVRVTALVSRLPPKVASRLRLVSMSLVLIFVIGLCQASYFFLVDSFELHMASSTRFRFPLQGPHMTMAIGFTLLAIILLIDIIRGVKDMRSGKNIEEESK